MKLGFRIPIVCGFQIPWAVFQIPKPTIPDSTSKNFADSGFRNQKVLDSGIRIPLLGSNKLLFLKCSWEYAFWLPRAFENKGLCNCSFFVEWIVADSNWIENGSGSCRVKRAIKTTFLHLWHATNTELKKRLQAGLQAINAVFLTRVESIFWLAFVPLSKVSSSMSEIRAKGFDKGAVKWCLRFKSKARLKCR